MTCPHASRVIDGFYSVKAVPVAVGWTCLTCKTSGAVKWDAATHDERAAAFLAEMGRDKESEMTG